jgi:hypothetical protein
VTRLELITAALKIGADTTLGTEALDWLNNILTEYEASGLWRALEAETTYQTENNVASVAFSASKFPAAALTDYSKALMISSDEPRELVYKSFSQLKVLAADGATGNPKFFTIRGAKLYLHPTPVTGSLPILTLYYYKDMTLPTADGDDIETVCGVVRKHQGFIIDGLMSYIFAYLGETDKAQAARAIWLQHHIPIMLLDNKDYYDEEEQKREQPELAAAELLSQQAPQGGGR